MEKLMELVQKQEHIIREMMDKITKVEGRLDVLEKDYGSTENVLLDGVNTYYKEYLDDTIKEESR